MTISSTRILQAPTPDILKDDSAHYRFLLELYNRTGGYTPSQTDLKGLTASVAELNTLDGVNLDETVQEQLDARVKLGSLGDMAFQHSNDISVTGGSLESVSINNSQANQLGISQVSIVSGTINSTEITTPTGSSAVALSSGVIDTDLVAKGSVGAAETDLISYLLPAATLDVLNSHIEIMGFGTFAANANNKQLKLKFGSTTLYDSTALALNSGSWKVVAHIFMVSNTVQKCVVEISSSNALLTNSVVYLQATETLTLDQNILFTGTATTNDDIVQESLTVKFYKG